MLGGRSPRPTRSGLMIASCILSHKCCDVINQKEASEGCTGAAAAVTCSIPRVALSRRGTIHYTRSCS